MHTAARTVTLAIVAAAVSAGNICSAQNTAQNILIGDTKVTMLNSYTGVDKLPKPTQTIVYPFTVPAEIVTIDQSAAARVLGRGPVAQRRGNTSQEDLSPATVAAKVEQGFTRQLIEELSKTAIPTLPGDATASLEAPRKSLTVQGYFTSVNEGNKTARMMIGLGRGASDVKAHVVVSLATSLAPVTIAEFDITSESGKKPGAAATMGAGSVAAGAAAGGSTDNKATVEGDTIRLAKAVAKEVENIMAKQDWIAATK